jgi:hypothetical protein
MRWLALCEAWWPIAIAVAWVLMRDRHALEQLLARHARKPITLISVATHAAALKISMPETTFHAESTDTAFQLLRRRLDAGEIEVIGDPFVRTGHRHGDASRLEVGTPQTIPYAELRSLVPYHDHDQLCLIPRDWRAAHESGRIILRGYRNVQTRSAALLRFFHEEQSNGVSSAAALSQAAARPGGSPDAVAQPDSLDWQSEPAAPTQPRGRNADLPRVQQEVLAAHDRLWPDGNTPPLAKHRDEAIVQEVKKILGTPVSRATIRRALRARRTTETNSS